MPLLVPYLQNASNNINFVFYLVRLMNVETKTFCAITKTLVFNLCLIFVQAYRKVQEIRFLPCQTNSILYFTLYEELCLQVHLLFMCMIYQNTICKVFMRCTCGIHEVYFKSVGVHATQVDTITHTEDITELLLEYVMTIYYGH